MAFDTADYSLQLPSWISPEIHVGESLPYFCPVDILLGMNFVSRYTSEISCGIHVLSSKTEASVRIHTGLYDSYRTKALTVNETKMFINHRRKALLTHGDRNELGQGILTPLNPSPDIRPRQHFSLPAREYWKPSINVSLLQGPLKLRVGLEIRAGPFPVDFLGSNCIEGLHTAWVCSNLVLRRDSLEDPSIVTVFRPHPRFNNHFKCIQVVEAQFHVHRPPGLPEKPDEMEYFHVDEKRRNSVFGSGVIPRRSLLLLHRSI